MSYKNKYIQTLHATTKDAQATAAEVGSELTELMSHPDYLRQSSNLINEALQKGFDVLQLANGDIVTTGTKTIVYQYAWDGEKNKLVKAKSSEKKTKKTKHADGVEEMIEESLDEE